MNFTSYNFIIFNPSPHMSGISVGSFCSDHFLSVPLSDVHSKLSFLFFECHTYRFVTLHKIIYYCYLHEMSPHNLIFPMSRFRMVSFDCMTLLSLLPAAKVRFCSSTSVIRSIKCNSSGIICITKLVTILIQGSIYLLKINLYKRLV